MAVGLFNSLFRQGGDDVLAPTIDGTVGGAAEVGDTVSALVGGLTPTGTIQWLANSTIISGATSADYLVSATYLGQQLSVDVDGVESAWVPIYHPAPTASGSLANQTLDQDSGNQTLPSAPEFTFSGTPVYTLPVMPIGVTVNASTGLITFATNSMVVQTSTPVTVRCADSLNSARFAEIQFTVTIQDVTAPVLTSPVDTASGATAGNLSVTTDEGNGTGYGYVSTSPTPPNATDLKAGNGADWSGNQVVSAAGAINFTASGLSDSTLYYAHFLQTDAAGNDSAIVSADGFTTDDATAPALSSPTAAANGANAATGSVSTDEGNGTLHWVVTQSPTSPNATQIEAGQDHTGSAADDSGSQSVSGTGVQNLSPAPSGLAQDTTYYIHYMHEDAAANQSAVASSASFTTTATDTTAPVINSATYDAPTRTLNTNITEASGSVTRRWALVTNPSTPSKAQIAAGTGGGVLESGSYTAVNGDDAEVITVTNEAGNEIHFYDTDGSGNESGIEIVTGITVDSTAPSISSSDPADEDGAHPAADSIVVTFTENMVFGDSGNITLRRDSGGGFANEEVFDVAADQGTGPGQVQISGAVLTINPTADGTEGDDYSIQIDPGALEDVYGNAFPGISDDTTLNFTIAAAGSGATFVQHNTASSETSNQAAYTSNPITIGSGSNRMVVALVSMLYGANSGNLAGVTATYDGNSMTEISGARGDGGRRPRTLIFAYANPGTGSGTCTVTFPATAAGCAIMLVELEDCDQTIANAISDNDSATSSQDASVSLTAGSAGWVSLSCLSILSGDFTADLDIADGQTQMGELATGTSGASDLTASFAREDIDAAADVAGFDWSATTGNRDYTMSRVAFGGA